MRAKRQRMANHRETHAKTAIALRDFIGEIRSVPLEVELAFEVLGEFATIMQLGGNENARTQGPGGSLTLVAGTGFEPVTFRL